MKVSGEGGAGWGIKDGPAADRLNSSTAIGEALGSSGKAGSEQLGKIAVAHFVRGHSGEFRVQRTVLAKPLVIGENEQLILDYGHAYGAAKLIAFERQFDNCPGCRISRQAEV